MRGYKVFLFLCYCWSFGSAEHAVCLDLEVFLWLGSTEDVHKFVFIHVEVSEKKFVLFLEMNLFVNSRVSSFVYGNFNMQLEQIVIWRKAKQFEWNQQIFDSITFYYDFNYFFMLDRAFEWFYGLKCNSDSTAELQSKSDSFSKHASYFPQNFKTFQLKEKVSYLFTIL